MSRSQVSPMLARTFGRANGSESPKPQKNSQLRQAEGPKACGNAQAAQASRTHRLRLLISSIALRDPHGIAEITVAGKKTMAREKQGLFQ
jgi:hypothetical protein